jgi:hypothetical protein
MRAVEATVNIHWSVSGARPNMTGYAAWLERAPPFAVELLCFGTPMVAVVKGVAPRSRLEDPNADCLIVAVLSWCLIVCGCKPMGTIAFAWIWASGRDAW